MRVLALVTDAYGGDGGIACYNRDLITALAVDENIECINVFPRNGSAGSLPQKVFQLAPQKNKFFYVLHAFRHCLKFRPQVVFCGHLFLLPLAIMLGRIFRIKIWLQLHGIEAWQAPSGRARKNLRHVDMVTCVSRHTRRRFLAWSDIDSHKIHILPNTVSAEFMPQARDSARNEYHLEDETVLLTVSRLASAERYKGHDSVLRSLPQLLENNPDLLYLIAGEGDDRPRLENLALTLNVQKAVRFLGKIPNAKLPALYSAADLFLMPSTGEGFGIVFLEAMACGTPALGLDCDGSSDPLRDGELGFISDAENLIPNIEKALSLGRPDGLSDLVHANFGNSNFQNQVSALCKKLCGEKSGHEISPCAA